MVKRSPVWYISVVAQRLNKQTQCTVAASSMIFPLCQWFLIKHRNVECWVKNNIMSCLGKYWWIFMERELKNYAVGKRWNRVLYCLPTCVCKAQLPCEPLPLLPKCPYWYCTRCELSNCRAAFGFCTKETYHLFWLYFAFQDKGCLDRKRDW